MSDEDRERSSVLVVEDEPDIRELFCELLGSEGFRVLTAADGAQALGMLEVVPVDLILLDIMMPVMDGFAFLRVYGRRPAPRAPVVAVSGMRDYLSPALQLGAVEAHDKVAAFSVLPARIRAILAARPLPPPPAPPFKDGDDARRLAAILALSLDQPAPGEAMQAFTEQVARLFEVPACLVSIVTRDRQYWTAFCGLGGDLGEARGTPRGHSFCTHAVVGRCALVVQDAKENPFFCDNVLVRERGLRFYAGVPISAPTGEVVGTLCLVDFRPRPFTHFDLELLGVLAKRVMGELDWRLQHRCADAPLSTYRHLTYFDEELGILGRDAFLDVLRVQACRASERGILAAVLALHPTASELARASKALAAAFPEAQLGRLGGARLGAVVLGCSAEDAGTRARAAVGEGAPLAAAALLPSVAAVELCLRDLEVAVG
jgi:CheY-like chemotaxis protein